ncbi:b(0,+)-type amino acid transporter 1 [Quaeritorhiza haematococci]|nr:b(0,+)-type amino acid transporter 1 [Quaeritorhiza haematococci]
MTKAAPSGGKEAPKMGVMSAIFLVAGGIIGAGIFATPSDVVSNVGSVGAAMALWVVGGMASMLGALSYVEWGQMFPGKSGGDQLYLLHGFPRPRALIAFLFCFTGVFLIKPGYTAAIGTVAGKYMLFGILGPKDELEASNPFIFERWDYFNKLAAILIVTLIHLTLALSMRVAIRVMDLLSAVKLTLLAVFCVAGIVVLTGATRIERTDNFANIWANTNTNPGNYVSALFSIFYVYDGWNYLNYNAGDLNDPVRTLPRGSIGGVLICTFLYCLVNVAFLGVVPYQELVKAKELLGSTFAVKVFGHTVGRKVVPFLIGFAAYGACSAVTFGAARIIQTAATQNMLPKSTFFAQTNQRFGTPVNALLLNWFIAALLICVPPGERAFSFLVALATYPAWIFYGASLVGLILFRRLQPNWPRPYRVWLVAPIFVIGVAAFLAIFPFTGKDWLSSLVGLVLMLLGIPIYFLIRRRFKLEELEDLDGLDAKTFKGDMPSSPIKANADKAIV